MFLTSGTWNRSFSLPGRSGTCQFQHTGATEVQESYLPPPQPPQSIRLTSHSLFKGRVGLPRCCILMLRSRGGTLLSLESHCHFVWDKHFGKIIATCWDRGFNNPWEHKGGNKRDFWRSGKWKTTGKRPCHNYTRFKLSWRSW